MNTIRKTARIAGFLYFMHIAASFISNLFGPLVFVDALAETNSV